MKKTLCWIAAGAVLLSGSMLYAGDGCCQSNAKGDKAMGCGGGILSKLNLTDDQKAKVTALKADCAKECTKNGCTPEARDKFTKGMKDILTPDQFTQWQQATQKMGKGSCPAMKSDTKS